MTEDRESSLESGDHDAKEGGPDIERVPRIVVPGNKEGPGSIRMWWARSTTGRFVVAAVGLVAIAATVVLVAGRLSQSQVRDGPEGWDTLMRAPGDETPVAGRVEPSRNQLSPKDAPGVRGKRSSPDTETSGDRFTHLQDSLAAAIDRYESNRVQFEENRSRRQGGAAEDQVDCEDLRDLYQTVDDRLVELAAEYQSSRSALSSRQQIRYRELFDQVSGVDQSYDETGCPRPE